MASYGYFDDTSKEYVVTNPATPIKWCNYVGTLQFGGIVDTTGGSLICKGDPALNRITKYLSWMPASDFKGSTVYIRIKNADGSYRIFSPFVTPTLEAMEKWECHVGLSYTRWLVEHAGLKISITVFVPSGSNTLLQDIRVTNAAKQAQAVDIIPVYEFSHFDALKHLTNADWVPQTMTLKAHPESSGHIVLEQYAFMKRDLAVNYATASQPVTSFDGDRRKFLGNNEMGSWAKPLSLLQEKLGNSQCDRGDNIAAQLFAAGSLACGAEYRVVTQLGQEASLKAASASIKKYRDHKNVDAAFAELAAFWEGYLQAIQVKTPDAAFDSTVNIHNPRQCHTTKNWSRYLSLYQLGYGSDRGIGFRDSSQDLLGVMSHMPEEARVLAENLLSVQKRDGSAMHQYFPSTMEANEGDSREKEDRPKYYGDDHLWIVLTVASYLRETGKLEFLDKSIPFYDKDKEGKAMEEGTVWEHLCRSLRFTQNHRGQHGLPLLGFADWNDTVNLPTGAESMFNANLFGTALKAAIEIAKATGKTKVADEFQRYYFDMKKVFNDTAWDGKWWRRWYDHQGKPLGSDQNQYGKIQTNGQSWPVISGFAEGERAELALDAVYEHMNTKNGIKLSWPGYNGFDPNLGGVSTYPPGAKENGGIFLHANPWVMIAETMIGRGDRAYQYYKQINPAAKNEVMDEFESEPYCYPQNMLGDEHPQFGLGRNAWLSGTSSWSYQVATQYICGVRTSLQGLVVDPCIPPEWPGFEITRVWRGVTYRITVKNPDRISKGVKSISLNGKPLGADAIAACTVPVQAKGEQLVEVVMGSV